MILEERYLPLKEAGNIFKLVAEELSANVHTQIIICNDILNEFKINDYDNVCFVHNYPTDHWVSQWYTLHEGYASSPAISILGKRSFCHNYSHLTKFYFRGYNFSCRTSRIDGEFVCYEYEIQRILTIEVS